MRMSDFLPRATFNKVDYIVDGRLSMKRDHSNALKCIYCTSYQVIINNIPEEMIPFTNRYTSKAEFLEYSQQSKRNHPNVQEIFTDGSKMDEEQKNMFEKLKVSRRTIGRRVVNISNDIKKQLEVKVGQFMAYSIAIDESTDVTDTHN
ncbi:hypothetical protein ANN_21420 [Periplaneta americana]|uniref:Uncharacterized protein n=1 Tax=Periplaneta americana TaxID=6978 RepID=A0ABQ8SG50_PERAM|nr:hypothetical protein ANN_21420 [Periplaneta americana]